MPKGLKTVLVVCAVIGISTLGIAASDLARGIDGRLTGLIGQSDALSVCGEGAVQFNYAGSALCVDQYEASPSPECPHQQPNSLAQTASNLINIDCSIETKAAVEPWRFVSLTEAQQLCARAEKRLPTNQEWYRIVLTLTDSSGCTVHRDSVALTGNENCSTSAGVYDLVGNVWEWTDGKVQDGHIDSTTLPESGYVAVVSNDGYVLKTTTTPQSSYGEDYAWTAQSGVFGTIRGGFYGGGTDAGIFSQNFATPFDLRTSGIGFRCVRDVVL